MRLIALILIPFLAACTQFPQLDDAVSARAQDANYPDLVPVNGLLARAEPQNGTPEQTVAAMNARVAALRARASRVTALA